MWFELNLIKKGLVSIDQMLSAVKRQQLSRVPIGRVAIEQGKMTMSQVFQVLQEQAENPKSFGRLAIDMDFLSEEELSHLLRMQGNLEQPLGEILIEMGCLSREQLEAESQLFQRQMTLRFETYDRQENPCSPKLTEFGATAETRMQPCLIPKFAVSPLRVPVNRGWPRQEGQA